MSKKISAKKSIVLLADTLGRKAYERIGEIAENSESEKMRFDASKWLCEMAFGKTVVQPAADGGEEVIKVELEGELKKWAK